MYNKHYSRNIRLVSFRSPTYPTFTPHSEARGHEKITREPGDATVGGVLMYIKYLYGMDCSS